MKAQNPAFMMIQYRLGLGLGRHTQIRFGDRWLPEWPANAQARWFYLYHGSRVFPSWGWYLMNPDDHVVARVLRRAAAQGRASRRASRRPTGSSS